MNERFYPTADNLGTNCSYWQLGGLATACCFPKAELEGRRSCEGIIDDVCLFIKDGRETASLSEAQRLEIRTTIPNVDSGKNLPPGDAPLH